MAAGRTPTAGFGGGAACFGSSQPTNNAKTRQMAGSRGMRRPSSVIGEPHQERVRHDAWLLGVSSSPFVRRVNMRLDRSRYPHYKGRASPVVSGGVIPV